MNHIQASPRAASRRLALALATLSLGAVSVSHAQTSGTWTSTTGGNWSNIANWSSGSGPVASGSGSTATFSASGTQTVNLDASFTVGTIAFSTGTYTVSSSNGSVLTLDSGTSTAPVISGAGTISATLAGAQGFSKSSNNTLTISGTNTYTGVTTLTNGNLTIRSSNALGASGAGNGLVVSQASGQYPQFHIANNITLAEDITLRMNWYNIANNGSIVGGNLLFNDSGDNILNGTLTLDRYASSNSNVVHLLGIQSGSGSLTINGAISGAATNGQASGTYANPTRLQFRATTTSANVNVSGVISDGTLTVGGLSLYTATDNNGIVRLSGANTYTGSTVHQKGSLLVNNATGSGTGVGAVSVANTATFGGFGIVAPTGANGVTFASGSIVAPGDLTSAGAAKAEGKTLTFDLSGTTGKVTFETGSIIALDLVVGAPTVAESFSFLGLTGGVSDVVFNSNVVNFSVTGSVLADGLYTLATFDAANSYSGQWVIGSGLDAYAIKSLVYGANAIQLQIGASAIPEPSSAAALAGLAALGLGATRRRRARR